jgi:hypothetical protein
VRTPSRLLPALTAALVVVSLAWCVARTARVKGPRFLGLAQEGAFALPRLPVTVRVVDATAPGSPGDGFCRSELLRAALKRRDYLWLSDDPGVSWPPDFSLECSEQDWDSLRFVLRRPDGEKVYGASIQRIGGAGGDDLAARQIALVLGTKSKYSGLALSAACVAYMAANQNRFAERGARALADGRDDDAAELLALGLESNLNAAALYFGLAEAYARQGLADQAYWYFAAYLESAGRSPDDAADQVESVLGAMPETPARAGREEVLLSRWRAAQDAGNWNDALELQRELAVETPWDESLYDRTERAYAAIGWDPLARVWAERLATARRVNADEALMRRLRELVGS